MIERIQILRGTEALMKPQNMLQGELYYATDTKRLWVGNGDGTASCAINDVERQQILTNIGLLARVIVNAATGRAIPQTTDYTHAVVITPSYYQIPNGEPIALSIGSTQNDPRGDVIVTVVSSASLGYVVVNDANIGHRVVDGSLHLFCANGKQYYVRKVWALGGLLGF